MYVRTEPASINDNDTSLCTAILMLVKVFVTGIPLPARCSNSQGSKYST